MSEIKRSIRGYAESIKYASRLSLDMTGSRSRLIQPPHASLMLTHVVVAPHVVMHLAFGHVGLPYRELVESGGHAVNGIHLHDVGRCV